MFFRTKYRCCALFLEPELHISISGEHDRRYEDGDEQFFKAARVIAHPYWNNRRFDNDIALIKLDRPAKFNNKVSTVCLPNGHIPIGSECYITGKIIFCYVKLHLLIVLTIAAHVCDCVLKLSKY